MIAPDRFIETSDNRELWLAARLPAVTLLGVVAVLTFIALTVAGAPSKAPNHNEQEQG